MEGRFGGWRLKKDRMDPIIIIGDNQSDAGWAPNTQDLIIICSNYSNTN